MILAELLPVGSTSIMRGLRNAVCIRILRND
jgi:hypothetical protein